MARTALYAPAHRVMSRFALSMGQAAQAPTVGPSFDAVAIGLQDGRWRWSGGHAATAPEVIGWLDPGLYPVLDVVPATLNAAAFAANQVPTSGTPLTLVASSGNGVVVPTSATLMLPGGQTAPTTARFVQAVSTYLQFGYGKAQTWAYDPTTMLERCITVTSVGNDSGATIMLTGIDAYGYLTRQQLTMGSGGAVTSTKAFKALLSAVPTGTLSGSNVSVGTADIFGLPFYGSQLSQLQGYWNNAILYGLGTFVAGSTVTSTATTGDTCGTWAPPNASDGTKRLTLFMRPWPPRMITAGINTGTWGLAQF